MTVGFRGGLRCIGLAAIVVTTGCATSTAARMYPEIDEHAGERINDVLFVNADPFSADTLLTFTQTKPSRCNFLGLPICVPFTQIGREEHHLSTSQVATDVETLERFYRISGYFGTRVRPSVEPDGDNVDVTFTILRGDPIILDALAVDGTEGVMDPDSLAETLPLQPGDIFHLGRFIESSEQIVRSLERRGYVYAESFRSFTVDTIDDRAEAAIGVSTGPQVTVDSIIVTELPHLGRSDVVRQLEVRQGELLRSSELQESQRNLYTLELISLASVTLAPDSLQLTPEDSSTATVLVAISEAPLREIEAAIGFGTVECVRTEVQWVNRSFTGGARRLALEGSLRRLGVGEPFSVSGGDRVCQVEPGDSLFSGNQFDYRFTAELTQPYFLSPRNQIALDGFAERISEPGVFSREAYGGGIAVTRRLAVRSGTSAGVEFEQGKTLASPGLFCAAFLVCDVATIDSLAAPRFRAEIGASYFMDATDAPIDPTSGYQLRTGVGYATPLLGSEMEFFRWTGEASKYNEVQPEWVAAFALRFGNFFKTATTDPRGDFLPPAERFFAGGATTVRGYPRNALGDGVYVTDSDSLVVDNAGNLKPWREAHFVPTGGTSLAIANAELRFPSPFMSRTLRLAVFVDAGAVGNRSLWDIAAEDWRITPGFGIRVQTPVGPLRVDIGINPYSPRTAPLLVIDSETGGLRRIGVFTPARSGFFNRMQVHVGIGNAF